MKILLKLFFSGIHSKSPQLFVFLWRTFSPKSGSRNLKKLLDSAISSAENNYGLDIDTLFVSHISVDEALIMKRIRARARGRADRIEKKTCHINLKLSN